MKCELHLNGRLILELQPENALERLFLTEMATGATQGKVVTVAQVEGSETVKVAVDK